MSNEITTLEKIKKILFGEQKPIVENKLADGDVAPANEPAPADGESDGEQASEDEQMEALANAIADLQTRVANIEAELGDQANEDGSTADGMKTAMRKMKEVVTLLASQPQSAPVRKTQPLTPYAAISKEFNSKKESRDKQLAKIFSEVKKNTANINVLQPKSLKEQRNITPTNNNNNNSKDNLFSAKYSANNFSTGFGTQK